MVCSGSEEGVLFAFERVRNRYGLLHGRIDRGN